MDQVSELWAVIGEDGNVMWSRGGSSTKPKLMVYPSESAAERALNNSWIKQIIPDRSKVQVKKIWERSLKWNLPNSKR